MSRKKPTPSIRHLLVAATALLLPAERAWAAGSFVNDVLSGTHPWFEALAFYMFALAVVVSALGICFSREIVRMAVWLFATLSSVAVLYLLLAAPFLAAIQLIVYAGGTLVLLVFGVMLTSKSPWVRFETSRRELVAGAVVGLALVVGLIGVVWQTNWARPASTTPPPDVADLGRALMTTYLVPFEVTSVLLLVVMIGAAYLVRQEKSPGP